MTVGNDDVESGRPSASSPSATFRLVGTLHGNRVTAVCQGRRTLIDATLREAAQHLVSHSALVGSGALRRPASLNGNACLTLATLIRACDTVEECSYAMDHITVDYCT